MNQRIQKIISMFLISLLVYIPIISFADNQEENKEPQIVKVDDEKCIIYIEDLQNTKFNYSLSLNQEGEYDKLTSYQSGTDSENNQVVVIKKEDFNYDKNNKAYLKVKQENNIKTIEVDFSKAITKQDLQNVETTCERINTEIVSDIVEEDFNDENGVHKILKISGVKINDATDNSQYYYDIKNGNEVEIMNIAKKINSEYKDMDMYNKIKIAKEFNEQYNLLINNADWKDVEENTIKQPKEAEENSEYVVLIKRIQNDNEITDIKFLTSIEDKNEAYENEKIATQETSKLPITGDSIILIVSFVLILGALIFTFIKMRKDDGKKAK